MQRLSRSLMPVLLSSVISYLVCCILLFSYFWNLSQQPVYSYQRLDLFLKVLRVLCPNRWWVKTAWRRDDRKSKRKRCSIDRLLEMFQRLMLNGVSTRWKKLQIMKGSTKNRIGDDRHSNNKKIEWNHKKENKRLSDRVERRDRWTITHITRTHLCCSLIVRVLSLLSNYGSLFYYPVLVFIL